MPEPQHQPLVSSQTSLITRPADGDSTKRALKVAGFTVLACALIAGQALTAYFLLSQKSQISNLQDSANALKKEMTHRQSGGSSAGVIRMPMSSMAMMINDEDPKPKEPAKQKPCLEQTLEAEPSGFRPLCDAQGNFLPMQCQEKPRFCWCVKPDGQMIPGSARAGKANCGDTARAMFHLPAMSGVMATDDE